MVPIDEKYIREQLTDTLQLIRQIEASATPPQVQEIVIARRAVEDARMRLGVSEAYGKEFDPWSNQVNKKEEQ